MVRLACVLLMIIASCLGAAAKAKPFIELTLETREAFLGDTIVVEVRWSGLPEPPDLSPLFQKATLLRETSGTRLAVLGGEVVDVSSRRLELEPQRLGPLQLGPVEADGIVSNSVSLNIEAAFSVDWTPGHDDVQLTQTIAPAAPWLQQQVMVEIQLRSMFPIADEVVTLPDFSGFRVVPIVTARRTLNEKQGWAETTWRYLAFPQQSGPQRVKGTTISGIAIKSRAERGRFKLAAPDNVLNVKPSAFGEGRWWLAAKSVTLADQWSKTPIDLTAGDEVERVVTVSARGVLPEQIPNLTIDETRGLSITPLGVERKGGLAGDEATAEARFTFRIKVLSPGSIFVDTMRLRWWNTLEDRAADAVIPARRIEIATPERGALTAQALAEQSWPERLAARLDGLTAPIYALAVLLACILLLLALPRGRIALAQRLTQVRLRRELETYAHNNDAAGLYERLRRLARDAGPECGQRYAPLLDRLGAVLFGNTPGKADLQTIVREAVAVGLQTRSTDGAGGLPSL